MHQLPYPLDHIGIAVNDLDEAIASYKQSFEMVVELREELPEQQIELVFLTLPNTKLELLAPTGPNSTLARFLEKRGPGLHHLCYQVPDIVSELKRLEDLGHELIDKTPRKGAHNSKIAFIHPRSTGGVLTELCEHA